MVKSLTRNAQRLLSNTVLGMFGMGVKDGDVGIEIEVEGVNLPDVIPKYWNAVADGSLRGESKEYVFKQPLKLDKANEALILLNKTFDEYKSKISESYRTSVHVHVNVQSLTFKQLYTYMCLYITFEDILIDMCGPERGGNLFCLRVSDAEHLLESLRNTLLSGNHNTFVGDHLRYASMNVNSVGKYGSLEFRAYRGTTKTEDISLWASLLVQLREAAKLYDNPQQIVEAFSKDGFVGFTNMVFGEGPVSEFILRAKNAESRMMIGVRYTQQIAYTVKDWNIADARKEAHPQDIYAALVNNDAPLRGRVNLNVAFADLGIARPIAAGLHPQWGEPVAFDGEEI